MRLFERGKLLGKINVIDVIIVIVVFGVIIGGGLYLKRNVTHTVSTDKILYVIEVKDVPDEIEPYIIEGETINDTEKLNVIGKILSKTSKPMMDVVENTTTGVFEEKETPNKKDVLITVQADYEIGGDGIDYVQSIKVDGSFEVRAGKSVSFKTKSYSGQGYIVSIGK